MIRDYTVNMWFWFYSDSEEEMKALEADLLTNMHTSKVTFSFFLNQGLKNIWTLIINMVSFSYSNNFPLRQKSSLGGISFMGKLFLKFKGLKGVDVTGKEAVLILYSVSITILQI